MIAVGVALTAVMVIGSAIDFPLGGGVGEREERPAAVSALREEYQLGIGQLTVDLSDLSTAELVADARTRVRVGIGQLVVIVPEGLAVRVEARATVGNVRIFEDEEGGSAWNDKPAPVSTVVARFSSSCFRSGSGRSRCVVGETRPSRAGLVAGVFFIVAGVAFLLERLDVWELEIRTLAPALLIALGFVVLLSGRSGEDRS